MSGLRQAGDVVDLDYPPFFVDRLGSTTVDRNRPKAHYERLAPADARFGCTDDAARPATDRNIVPDIGSPP